MLQHGLRRRQASKAGALLWIRAMPVAVVFPGQDCVPCVPFLQTQTDGHTRRNCLHFLSETLSAPLPGRDSRFWEMWEAVLLPLTT